LLDSLLQEISDSHNTRSEDRGRLSSVSASVAISPERRYLLSVSSKRMQSANQVFFMVLRSIVQ